MARRYWLAATALAFAGYVHGQGYPNQPIKLIVPWPPGGGSPDDFTRFVGSEIARYADIVKASGAKVE